MVNVIEDINNFQIIRSEWLFGKGKNTRILDFDGKKDCFGFLLLASGANNEDLLNVDEPIDVAHRREWLTKLIGWSGSVCYQTEECINIIKVNDDHLLEQSLRETKLIELFKSIGINLTFSD